MKKMGGVGRGIKGMLPVIILLAAGMVGGAEGPPPYAAPEISAGSLTGEEIRVWEAALHSILLEWEDMRFKKDYVDDPYRLDAVQRALDDPVSLIEWNYGWDAFLLEGKATSDILFRAAGDLDCGITKKKAGKIIPDDHTISSWTRYGFTAEWSRNFSLTEHAVSNASEAVKAEALGSLTDEELAFLRSYLLCRFEEEEKLEGVECPEEEEYGADEMFLESMEHYDIEALLKAAVKLVGALEELLPGIEEYGEQWGVETQTMIERDYGNILMGTEGDDVWLMEEWGPAAILIDPGGNDIYRGQVCAAGNFIGEKNPLISLLIDISGDDTYIAEGKRAAGSGVLGIAVHYDLDGDDIYRSGKFSQGCGLFGVGILDDRRGDDIYYADLLVQGAGAAGIGLLQDSAGRDNYQAAFYAQGFGYTLGWGMLTDRDGYDHYYAAGKYDAWPTWGTWMLSCSQGYAFGIRPVASGGIGILHDRNGKDFYSAEVFSQGGSYWYGIGALIDDNDNDQYTAGVYSQAAGVHLSAGILLDRSGNDDYTCDHQAQGFAHDFSVGWLIDEAGNDNYSAKTNAQGCAVTNSTAGIIDREGDDGYLCRDAKKGSSYGETTRGYGNIGIQIDMKGRDSYSYPEAGDGKWWTLQSWYAGIDVGDDWYVVEDSKQKTDEETGVKVEPPRRLIIPGIDDQGGE